MSAGQGLAAVIVAFMAIMAVVLVMSFRERKASQALESRDTEAAGASDARVLATIFLAIPGGMLLTLITAWLVFF
jgi:hypothetical protein